MVYNFEIKISLAGKSFFASTYFSEKAKSKN